jgi:hypothetical protein
VAKSGDVGSIMTIFIVVGSSPAALLKASIERNYSNNFYEIAPDQFALKADGVTSEEVARNLGANGWAQMEKLAI